jgi:hypothetical protein
MFTWLKNLLSNLWAPKPDPRPDPEDPVAYTFVDEILKQFDLDKEHYQVLPDGKKPTDVPKAFPPEAKAKEPAGYLWWVDVYESPKGNGFQVCFEIIKDTKRLRKTINFGPEDYREQDWKEIE